MSCVSDFPEQPPRPPEPGEVAVPLADAVRRALDGTGHAWLRLVTVTTEGGCVVLRGRVPSYYLKQLAQVTALAVPGVGVLKNELRVEGGGR